MARGYQLSDDELSFLGVTRIEEDKLLNRYIIHCDGCGKEMRTRTYSSNRIYLCKTCNDRIFKVRDERRRIAKERFERMASDSVDVDYNHYHRFAKASSLFNDEYMLDVHKAREAMEKFDSIPEIVACIELIHTGAKVIVHQKVGDFTVDFCLPDEKVVIEIDGSIYHTDEDKEFMRDYALKNMLGDGWIIRHIDSDLVMKNHKEFGKQIGRLLDDLKYRTNCK